MHFGQRLAMIRKQRGLTQDELGERVDTSGDIISKYERGVISPSLEVAAKCAQALNVSLDHLAFGIANTDKPGELDALFQEFNNLSVEDKGHIAAVIGAFVTKAKLQSIIG